jgi:hypothetical protein
MQIKSKNGTVQSNGGEEQFFTFKGRKQLMEPCTHQNTDLCVLSSKLCSGSLHCPQSPAASIYIQRRVDHCWSRKKYPYMATTLDSWWVSLTPYTRTTISSYKCLHMDTQIVKSVSGRYHRCLHWIFSSADQATRIRSSSGGHVATTVAAAVDDEAGKKLLEAWGNNKSFN